MWRVPFTLREALPSNNFHCTTSQNSTASNTHQNVDDDDEDDDNDDNDDDDYNDKNTFLVNQV